MCRKAKEVKGYMCKVKVTKHKPLSSASMVRTAADPNSPARATAQDRQPEQHRPHSAEAVRPQLISLMKDHPQSDPPQPSNQCVSSMEWEGAVIRAYIQCPS